MLIHQRRVQDDIDKKILAISRSQKLATTSRRSPISQFKENNFFCFNLF